MKVFLDTIGCRLNQAEIEQYARQFRSLGHTLVADASQADLAVVNTCAVTTAAESDSRQKIRRIERQGNARIIVTGCWATLQPDAAMLLANVTQIVPNQLKDQLVSNFLEIQPEEFDLEPVERQPLPGLRQRTRLFVKTQDGCDNRCTFCITTLARGPGKSRPIREILKELQSAEDVKEIVLTGVHLGSWGKDFSQPMHLEDLIRAVLNETDFPRIRLSSLEPWDLEPGFFQLWEDARLCRHLHLPLQSGCAATLRRMARKTTPRSFAELCAEIRAGVPEMAITTDLISGFPGETEDEFGECLEFVEKMQFAGGHVFSYSPRPGTAAARMPDQVSFRLRKERAQRLREALDESSLVYRRHFLGEVLPVLWENMNGLNSQGWTLSGLTSNYIRVQATAERELCNQITPVRISSLHSEGLLGQIAG